MWLPQGGALKIENLQFTQYSIIMLLSQCTQSVTDTCTYVSEWTVKGEWD